MVDNYSQLTMDVIISYPRSASRITVFFSLKEKAITELTIYKFKGKLVVYILEKM